MKTLIAYSTTHGCTEKIAKELKQVLGKDVVLCNLKKDTIPTIENFDRIIIGGSIHAGQIQKRVKDFCGKYAEDLQNKELGLFICCMEKEEKAQQQLIEAFPENLLRNAKATACLGGEFNFEKMNFFQRMIVKKVAQVEETTSNIDHEAIKNFSKKMDRIFNPFLFLI